MMYEYKAIKDFYGDRCAKRSGVLLMNHIDEGLKILDYLNASDDAKAAYCLHPLCQSDEDLRFHVNAAFWYNCKPRVIILALEYRSVANEYLSHREISSIEEIRLSPLREVFDMLTADKVQNYKDFLKYHKHTHVRSVELTEYFNNWLARLDISEQDFTQLCSIL